MRKWNVCAVMIGVVCVAAVSACAGPARAQGDVQNILAKARAASGFAPDEAGQGVQLKGTAEMLGEPHTVSVLMDGRGSFLYEVYGKFPVAQCMVGDKVWSRDIGGETRLLHLGERDETVLYALFVGGGWTDDPRLTFASPGQGAEGATLAFTLAQSPVTGTVTLDPATSRVTRVAYHAGPDAHHDVDELMLAGTIAYGGKTFPADIELHNANGGVTAVHLNAASEAPTFIRSLYEPIFHAGDITFDAAKPPELEIKRAKTGHLLCRPTINGKQFDWFFFDTGAGSAVITPEVVNELKMERFGHVPVNGVGGSLTSNCVKADTIELGPVTMRGALMTELDLSFVANAIGEKISGIIGYNLLARCIAEIDQKGGTVRLYEPAAFSKSPEASSLKWATLITYERHPCVKASFEDHTGYFKLDTGAAGSTVSMHAPAVVRLKLLEGRDVQDSQVGGVGGMKSAKRGNLRWFELGGHRFENIGATFATETVGAFDDPYTLGNIGGDLMSPFVLVFDYQHERIAFKPRQASAK